MLVDENTAWTRERVTSVRERNVCCENLMNSTYLDKDLFDNVSRWCCGINLLLIRVLQSTRRRIVRSILHRRTCNHRTRRQTRQFDGYLGKLRHTAGKQSPEQNRSPLSSWEEAIHQHQKLCIPTTRSHTQNGMASVTAPARAASQIQ